MSFTFLFFICLLVQLVSTSNAFPATRSALFNNKASNHKEDLDLTRQIILQHIKDLETQQQKLQRMQPRKVTSPFFEEVEEDVITPTPVASAAPDALAAPSVIVPPKKESRIARLTTKAMKTAILPLKILPTMTSQMIRSLRRINSDTNSNSNANAEESLADESSSTEVTSEVMIEVTSKTLQHAGVSTLPLRLPKSIEFGKFIPMNDVVRDMLFQLRQM